MTIVSVLQKEVRTYGGEQRQTQNESWFNNTLDKDALAHVISTVKKQKSRLGLRRSNGKQGGGSYPKLTDFQGKPDHVA